MSSREGISMKRIKNIILRILATFVIGALGTIGAASIFGIDVWKAAAVAGLLATMDVIAELSRFYVADGKLTDLEVNQAFSDATKSEEKK
jgi:hypothetical protein